MNFEKYTDRARGFVQIGADAGAARGPPAVHARASAQGSARRHRRAGGRADRPLRRPLARGARRPSRRRSPRSRRSRAAAPASSIWSRARRACSTPPRRSREKAGDSFVTVERLLLALAIEKDSDAGKILRARRRDAAEPQRRHRGAAQGPHRRLAPRPRTPMTRSRNMPATSPRRRATASSIR